jgi:hypothetical protein
MDQETGIENLHDASSPSQADELAVRSIMPDSSQKRAASSSDACAGNSPNAARIELPRASAGPNRALRTTPENDSPSRFARRNRSYASNSKEIVFVAMHGTMHGNYDKSSDACAGNSSRSLGESIGPTREYEQSQRDSVRKPNVASARRYLGTPRLPITNLNEVASVTIGNSHLTLTN